MRCSIREYYIQASRDRELTRPCIQKVNDHNGDGILQPIDQGCPQKYLHDKNQVGGNLYRISYDDTTILVHLKEMYWTIASISPHGFKSYQPRIKCAISLMKDMSLYHSAEIIDDFTY
jgi:hypothetical protein